MKMRTFNRINKNEMLYTDFCPLILCPYASNVVQFPAKREQCLPHSTVSRVPGVAITAQNMLPVTGNEEPLIMVQMNPET